MRRTKGLWLFVFALAVVSLAAAGAAQAATIQGQIKGSAGTDDPAVGKTFAVVYSGTDACSAAYLTYGFINSDGYFTITDLPPTTGTGKQYFLKTWSDESKGEKFVDTWFVLNNTAGTYNCGEASGFSFITSNQTANAGTINLKLGDSIPGTVNPTGNPYTYTDSTGVHSVANTYVLVLKKTIVNDEPTTGCNSPIFMITPTASGCSNNCAYQTDNLPAGDYFLQTYSYNTYVSTWWATGNATTTSCGGATLVTTGVTGNPLTNHDFALGDTGGTISGTVSGPTDMSKILINVYDYDTSKSCNQGRWVTTAFVASDGKYTTPGLIPGNYILQSYSVDGTYANEYSTGVTSTTNCTGGSVHVNGGGNTSEINFQPDTITSTTISGTVYYAGTTTPISGKEIYVNVYESLKPANPVAGVCYQGKWITSAVVNSSGSYTTPYLPHGKYLLQSYSKDGFLNEWYKSTGTSSAYYCKDASEVSTMTSSQAGINFYLDTEPE
ncbi:hypothetical protein [Desulfatirhabdium butyrativorans]|uniref:hypothetical protein n=1 Tax=Desulfatirhabdium butyrativorans TaxID=340467 RepID=UPI000426DD38|nr:hypothetical protein [Desulfatirhabdium butyrativorans]